MSRRLLLAAAVFVLAAIFPAGALAAGPLQPGSYHETDAGACTLNFVYDGDGSTYMGTAAHCVESVGQRVRDMDGDEFGSVALIGNADSTAADWALIEIDAGDVGRVQAGVKGSPQFPTGVTTPDETAVGDPIQLSGFGLGFNLTPITQERRIAVMGQDDESEYDVTGPLIFGDSGGPLVHLPSGKALGIVSRLCIGVCTEEGPTVQGILAAAAARGLTVSVRTP